MPQRRIVCGDSFKFITPTNGFFAGRARAATTCLTSIAVGVLAIAIGGLSVGGRAPGREVAPPVHKQVGFVAQPSNAPIAPGVTSDKVKAALPELEKLATALLKETSVPGLAIAVVHQDQVVYAKGFGLREAGKPDPVDADTVFQLASVSKPLGSTVIAGLVGDRVAKWDDRIIDHDPGFQTHDPAAHAAGKSWEMLSQERLYKRLGMPLGCGL
ncbi:MAG: serine hydrolase domain-containing protein [Hyphomicrobiaceae bacterium]